MRKFTPRNYIFILGILLLNYAKNRMCWQFPNDFRDDQPYYAKLISGPNVCNETITIKAEKLLEDCSQYPKDYIDDRDTQIEKRKIARSSYFGTMTTQRCIKIRNYFQCQIKKMDHCWENETLYIYNCCYGYAQEEGQQGCPKQLSLQSMVDTLKRNNLGYFIEMNNITQALPIGENNITLLLPTKNAFQNIINRSHGHNLEDIYTAHKLHGLVPRSHMLQNQIFQTNSPNVSDIRINFFGDEVDHPQIKWTANCVPLNQGPDIETNQGLIIKLDGALPLEPINETSYQFLERIPKYSSMLHRLKAAGYEATLKNPKAHYTYLIPTNRGLKKLKSKYGLNKRNNLCAALTIKHHVFGQWICPNIFDETTSMVAQDDTPVVFNPINADTNEFLVEGSKVKGTKLTTNAHLIFIDEVLISEKTVPLVAKLADEPNASEFLKLIRKAQNGTSNGTYAFPPHRKDSIVILVPENSAFNALDEQTKSKLTNNVTYVKQFLENHIVPANDWDNYRKQLKRQNGKQLWKLEEVSRHDRLNCIRDFTDGSYFCGGKYVFVNETMKPIEKGLIQTLEELDNPNISVFLNLLKASPIRWNPRQAHAIWIPTNNNLEPLVEPYGMDFNKVINKTTLDDIIKRHVLAGYVDTCCNAIGYDFTLNAALTYPYNENGNTIYTGRDRTLGGTIDVNLEKCNILAKNWHINIVNKPLMGSEINFYPYPTYQHRHQYWAI